MIVVDTEATGMDPRICSIVSIGAVNFKAPEDVFYVECLPWEGAYFDPKATEINGIGPEVLEKSLPSNKEAMKSFFEWVKERRDHILAGHITCFETAFFMDSAQRHSLEYPFGKRTIDTHSLVYMHMVGRGLEPPVQDGHSKLTSTHIYDYVGIDPHRGMHNALEDAKLSAETISRTMYERPLLEEYKDKPIPWK